MTGDDALVQPLRACATCGLVHEIPDVPPRHLARCTRCRSVIRHGTHPASASRTAALALSALIVYPLALLLPIMTVERLGNESAASVWSGTVGLLAERHYAVGVTVLVFSILAPLGKLSALLVLSLGRGLRREHRAATFHAVEFIGRWGMLDVLLVAVVVAAVKLGDLVTVTPGPGVIVFGLVVVLSLLASMSFDPHGLWEGAA
jgi:paraquat-inducible protein A